MILAGGLNWPTLLVALAFPPYFVIRKACTVDSAAAQLLELAAMLPFTVLVLITQPSLATVTHRPGLIFLDGGPNAGADPTKLESTPGRSKALLPPPSPRIAFKSLPAISDGAPGA